MTIKEIRELIKLIRDSDLSEFKLKDDKFELNIRTSNFSHKESKQLAQQPVVALGTPISMPQNPAPVEPQPTAAPVKEETAPEPTEDLLEVKSPIIGTFYRSPSPDKPAFIKVGDNINAGDVVCIVEAMKLFNEIESEVTGKVVKVLVEDATPVEYDTPLFLVDPKG